MLWKRLLPLFVPLSILLTRTTATVPGALSNGHVMLNSFVFQGTLHPVCKHGQKVDETYSAEADAKGSQRDTHPQPTQRKLCRTERRKQECVVLRLVVRHTQFVTFGCERRLVRLTVPRCRAGKPSAECTMSIRLAKACVAFPFVTLPSNCIPDKQLKSSPAKTDNFPDRDQCSAYWAGSMG